MKLHIHKWKYIGTQYIPLYLLSWTGKRVADMYECERCGKVKVV